MFLMLFPDRYNRLFDHLNADFQVGLHHFEPFATNLTAFVEQEFDRFARRFQATEKDGVLILTLELPGFASGDLDIGFDRGRLTVTAKNAERDEEAHSVNVGRDIDPDTVDATLEKGLLTIKLHRLESAKPRKVPVK